MNLKPTVLLAEDDPMLTRMLETALAKWGYDVVSCSSGEAAWQILQKSEPPGLMILDWMLPDVEGTELCRRVRERENAPYTYLILLTSRSAHHDLLKGMEAGADDYLTKPCDLQELQMRVRAGQRILDLQTNLLQAQAELHRQATHDALTGIWNRGAILEILHRELERSRRDGQPLGVVMADVDYFKRINDTHGHQAGDKVLHDVAQHIKTCLRTYDAVGRYGGEEFLLVLPKCSLSSAAEIAERVRQQLAQAPIQTDAQSIPVTLSLGVAAVHHQEDFSRQDAASTAGTSDDRMAALLIGLADEALYQAKQQGRNRVVSSDGSQTTRE
jgi:diguanylate cyclase (GGDEF)-like protein